MDGAEGATNGSKVRATRDAALGRIAADHGAALKRFLRSRVFDPSEQDDLAQESFVRLSQVEAVATLDNPRAFLFRIAENLVRDRRRRRMARRNVSYEPIDDLELADPAPQPDVVLVHRDALARVQAAVLALDEPARTAFLLSRYRDMSYPEIADHMQVSVKTVEKYISSALVVLRGSVGSDRPDASIRTETQS